MRESQEREKRGVRETESARLRTSCRHTLVAKTQRLVTKTQCLAFVTKTHTQDIREDDREMNSEDLDIDMAAMPVKTHTFT